MADKQDRSEQAVTLTRRQALTALGVGAVTLTATHLGVAYEAAQWAQQEPRQTAADLAAEVEKLKGLLALYEGLEKIGIDAIISGALSAFKASLDTLRGGVGLLRGGVSAAEGAIVGFQNTFAAIRAGLKTAEDAVANIAALLKNAEDWLGQTTSPLQPMIQQVHQFFDDLLSKIPFGVGDNIRQTVNGLIGLVVAVPTMVQGVSTNLLEPLRGGWFSDDSAKNVQGALLDPIKQKVLDPLATFLGDVDQTLAHWESDVSTPVQAALDQRAAVHQQIADYKQKNGLG
jgi:hypothetical protein